MCAESRSGRRDRRSRAHARGQALTECIVVSLALVPLVLLIVWLGKIQSVRQSGIAASRALAFECTVRPDACADAGAHPLLAAELRSRAFGRADLPVSPSAATPAGIGLPQFDPLWVDRANRPLIAAAGDIGVRIEARRFDAGDALARARGEQMPADPVLVSGALDLPARFGLATTQGLVLARVQTGIASGAANDLFSGQLDRIPLRITAGTAILTDAWNAWGPYGDPHWTVASRVQRGGSLPDGLEVATDAGYALTRAALTLMHTIGLEPAASSFRYHASDVDQVPADRVGVRSASR